MELSYLEVIGRLLLAAVLGGLIGLERETLNRPAGLRTHLLVSMGSALVMLVSAYGFLDLKHRVPGSSYDAARVAAQVVSGIGFLGAGTILREGATVRGLTTAASLWTVSAIGLAVGIGMYVPATVASFLIYLALKYLVRVERRWLGVQRDIISLRILDQPGMIAAISGVLARHRVDIRRIDIDAEPGEVGQAAIELSVLMAPKTDPLVVIEEIGSLPGVLQVHRGEFGG